METKEKVRSFVRGISEEMQKQGDPVFYTESEATRLVQHALEEFSPKWISTEKELPDVHVKVMVLFGKINNILMGELHDEEKKLWQVWFSDGALLNIGYGAEVITHWMHIPQSPTA